MVAIGIPLYSALSLINVAISPVDRLISSNSVRYDYDHNQYKIVIALRRANI